mmetsp:Transcript_29535/g.56766  ORF Transcript_29535/g.56766 Transcript_29535/m.56766 type:complete len:226 (-) Transcript_29535:405-1082(-)
MCAVCFVCTQLKHSPAYRSQALPSTCVEQMHIHFLEKSTSIASLPQGQYEPAAAQSQRAALPQFPQRCGTAWTTPRRCGIPNSHRQHACLQPLQPPHLKANRLYRQPERVQAPRLRNTSTGHQELAWVQALHLPPVEWKNHWTPGLWQALHAHTLRTRCSRLLGRTLMQRPHRIAPPTLGKIQLFAGSQACNSTRQILRPGFPLLRRKGPLPQGHRWHAMLAAVA